MSPVHSWELSSSSPDDGAADPPVGDRAALCLRNGRAVLLWSEAGKRDERLPHVRDVLGVLAAVIVGIGLIVFNCLILLLPVVLVLVAVGAPTKLIVSVVLLVVALRALITCWRAFRTYQNKLALTAGLPSPTGLRWRIDFLAAVPARNGNGGGLLDLFLTHADQCGAEVVLHCDARNVAFYRHHGFHLISIRSSGGQHLMLRHGRRVPPRR